MSVCHKCVLGSCMEIIWDIFNLFLSFDETRETLWSVCGRGDVTSVFIELGVTALESFQCKPMAEK